MARIGVDHVVVILIGIFLLVLGISLATGNILYLLVGGAFIIVAILALVVIVKPNGDS
ncbi:hypothetical protein J4217_00310 [Candidatus Pacearchaeota archaeon]|nr:hypothetical protein [Candidatus Pacearchaeota archaeon]